MFWTEGEVHLAQNWANISDDANSFLNFCVPSSVNPVHCELFTSNLISLEFESLAAWAPETWPPVESAWLYRSYFEQVCRCTYLMFRGLNEWLTIPVMHLPDVRRRLSGGVLEPNFFQESLSHQKKSYYFIVLNKICL